MRAAELEGRDLSPEERRLWIASADTRCWVCGSTIYQSTGIPDGERQYCSRACGQRAANLRARYVPSGQSREKIAMPVGDNVKKDRANFAAAVTQLIAHQQPLLKPLRNVLLIASVLLFSLPLLLWGARTAHISRIGIWLLFLAVIFLPLFIGFSAARKLGKIEKAYGVKCPQCNRYFRGKILVHALNTGKCMLCGATIFSA